MEFVQSESKVSKVVQNNLLVPIFILSAAGLFDEKIFQVALADLFADHIH